MIKLYREKYIFNLATAVYKFLILTNVTTVVRKRRMLISTFNLRSISNMPPISCFCCGLYIKDRYKSRLANNQELFDFFVRTFEERGVQWIPPANESRICKPCYNRFQGQQRHRVRVNEAEEQLREQHQNGPQNKQKLQNSENLCCVCRILNRNRIPRSAILDLWMRDRIYCNINNRSCPEHLEGTVFNQNAKIQLRQLAIPYVMNLDEQENLIDLLTDQVDELNKKSSVDFDSPNLDDTDYICLTGLKREEFNTIVDYCDNTTSTLLSKRNCVGVFLVKMRSDPPQSLLAMIFGMRANQQPRISEIIHQVLDALNRNLVPRFLGFDHMTRDQLRTVHSNTVSNRLCRANANSLVALVDATYLFIQRSRDHNSQRLTYSTPKKSNLVKFSVVTAPDGYIVAVTGPHATDGKNNDSNIFNAMAVEEDGFFNFYREDDIIVLDRGYRDSREICNQFGLQVFMPHFVPPGQRQLTCQHSNESRIVTMLRWVIEAVFGRLQNKFRFLRNVVPNSYSAEALGNIYKVLCAISNAFFSPISSNGPEDDRFCDVVLERLNRPNTLLEKVLEENLTRVRLNWPIVNALEGLQDFPVLSENQIQDITLGTYQLKLAYAYTSSHLDHGRYLIRLHQDPANQNDGEKLIRASIPSRFQGREERRCFVSYSTELNGTDAITGWACLCKSGARVLGMCGHVASVIWFLGYARHQENIKYPSKDIAENLINVAEN